MYLKKHSKKHPLISSLLKRVQGMRGRLGFEGFGRLRLSLAQGFTACKGLRSVISKRRPYCPIPRR